MFCPECKSLMSPHSFGHTCKSCHEFVYRDGSRLGKEPHAVSTAGLAAVSISVTWPDWISVHPQLDSVKRPGTAFLVMQLNFPRYVWQAGIASRVQYAFALFRIAIAWAQAGARSELKDTNLRTAEQNAMAHLKRLVYGLDGAIVHFDPRFEGPHVSRFQQSSQLIRNVLSRLATNWLNPAVCDTCGLIGDQEELKTSASELGCSDCTGERVPFRLERADVKRELAILKASGLLRVRTQDGPS